MLYFKCPSCRVTLASRQLIWESKLENICMNNDLSDAEKDVAKRKLLDELQLKNPCCRSRLLGFCNLIYVVK